MAETLKITITNPSNYSEVVDSIADVFKIGITLENALEDGFQLQDILVAVQLEPVVREVINDFPVFVEQFKSLNSTTALQAVQEAKLKVTDQFGELGKVSGYIFDFLFQTAATYGFIEGTILQGITQLNAWKGLFSKEQA